MTEFYPTVHEDRGFLASPDPIERLPSGSGFSYLDKVAYELPSHVQSSKVRITLDTLPIYDISYSALKEHKERGVLNRLRMIYAYFASAYVHGQAGVVKHIPSAIARPLCALSEIVGRPPILSYADYALNNWKRIDKNSDISLGNIQLIQKFNNIYDEDWFILVHVEIEARAGRLLKSIYNLTEFLDSGKAPNDDFFAENLEVICSSFKGINTVLERMPEKCSPDVYFRKVRPYIFGFENVVYENVPSCSFFSGAKEQSFRGETGAQSSIVPAVLAAFGVKHQQSILTHHLDDMRKYMPRNHRGFVSHLEGSSVNIRDGIINNKLDKYVRATYNNIILQLCRFREIHFGYAVDYIQKKCDNPTGTGGTPYVKWLKELTEETKSYLLKTE